MKFSKTLAAILKRIEICRHINYGKVHLRVEFYYDIFLQYNGTHCHFKNTNRPMNFKTYLFRNGFTHFNALNLFSEYCTQVTGYPVYLSCPKLYTEAPLLKQ